MSRQGATVAGSYARAGVWGAAEPGYWINAPIVAIASLAVVAVRLHEFLSFLAPIKPVLLVAIGGAILLFSRSAPHVRKAVMEDPGSRLVLAYLAFMLLTVPFALYSALAFNTARALLPSVLLFFTIQLCPPRERVLDRLQSAFVVLVLLYAVYAQTFGSSRNGRLRIGGMYDSNDMASLMSIAFPLAAGMLTRAVPGRARLVAMLAVVALALGVIATGSRGGALSLAAGTVVFAFGFRGSRGFLVTALLAGGLFAAWANAPEDFRTRMAGITNLEDDYNYTHEVGRKAVWKRGRGYIKQHPITGVGAGNFPIAEGYSYEDWKGKWSAAHNAYVQVYAELGLFGGSIFVALLILAARRGLRLWRVKSVGSRAPPLDRPEFLAALAAYAAGAYFLSHAYFPPLFGLLGLIALAERTRHASGSVAATAPEQLVWARAPGQRGGLAIARRSQSF